MLARSSTNRLNDRFALLVAMLAALPVIVTFAVEQEKKSEAGVAILRGRVGGEIGEPLAGVRVRAAIPASDMRFVNPGSNQILFEAITDDSGEYRLEIAGITKPTIISVEAMKRGYRRLSGTLMRGGDAPRPEIVAGVVTETNLKLELARYFKGVVEDENGKPIPAVEISANANTSRSSAGVERTVSNQDGEFELFNYSMKPFALNAETTKGVLSFSHPNYVSRKIDDVYSLAENQRSEMRIVLPTGHRLSGIVRDTSGNVVPHVMVKAINRTGGYNRKAVMTDMDGRFALLGLTAGATVLSAQDLGLHQKVQLPLAIGSDINDLDVRLQAMTVPSNLKAFTVLGMRLTDATPELKAAYDLPGISGALILDPGPNSQRLNIGQLKHGYSFWMVGNQRIASVREFVERILAEADTQNRDQYSIRVVYNLSTLEFDGTNTQYLKLMKDDVEQLKIVLDQIVAVAK